MKSSRNGKRLVTSAEVLQELLHVYLPVGRIETLDAAIDLATNGVDQVIPISDKMVIQARHLADKYPGLTARDLLHLSVCQIHKISEMKTFVRNLNAAFQKQ
jgi:predicted nucleic acid-binding protein